MTISNSSSREGDLFRPLGVPGTQAAQTHVETTVHTHKTELKVKKKKKENCGWGCCSAGGMQEALGSIPNTEYTRHGVVHMPVISALKEVEAGELQAQGQPCLYNKLEASLSYRGPRLKENKKENPDASAGSHG